MIHKTENSIASFKGAAATGIINAVINGIIYWFQVRGQASIPITNDSITSREPSVFGSAILVSVILAIIIASIGYFTLKYPGKPAWFPKVFLLTIRNAFSMFGILVTLAILWQRIADSVFVTPLVASLIVALAAGIVCAVTEYSVKKELTQYPK